MHGVHARTTCAATANVSPVSCEADAAVGRGRDVLICADIGCKRSLATGAARCAGDQGVPQVADVRVSRSNPGFEIYAALRWPVAWLAMKSGSSNDLDGENDGDEPVDGGAERRSPPCAGAMPLLD